MFTTPARLGNGPFQTLQHPRLITLGLQLADEPRSGVGQPLVIQIDRVLGDQHRVQPKSARLLEQRQ